MRATVNAPAPAMPSHAAVMAQAKDENFPVATLVLGRRCREDLRAIYGFARLVDDIGDEASGDRFELLDEVSGELAQVFAGRDAGHPVMRALEAPARAGRLPEEPFLRLIEANRRDQVQTRYETFDELLSYCQLSAAPVGELVLHAFDAVTAARIVLSDRVCAGLQVIEHLQDVGEDYARGRVYLPREDLAAASCAEADLLAQPASPALRAVVVALARRSRELLAAGPPLMRRLEPRPRLALGGFVAGGAATLAALERAHYDVLGARPRRTRTRFVIELVRAMVAR
jgi:squalene synthase HpnC